MCPSLVSMVQVQLSLALLVCQTFFASARRRCRILQSRTVPLHQLRWSKAWWEPTCWRHSVMLIGLNNRDLLFSFKMFHFKTLISCFVYRWCYPLRLVWLCNWPLDIRELFSQPDQLKNPQSLLKSAIWSTWPRRPKSFY